MDFIIPAQLSEPEKLIITTNNPTYDAAKLALFAFNDTRQFRDPEAKNFVIFNDSNSKNYSDFSHALENYNVQSIPWSMRDSLSNKLLASR